MGKGGSVSAREGTVMPQDAPVNAGAADWPGLPAAEDAVAGMQARLHLWAARDPGCRFGDLFNLVYDPAFLLVAWERVAANRGADTPGIDRATAGQVETWVGVREFLGRLRDSLKSGEFRPVEVRRVLIPKKNGNFAARYTQRVDSVVRQSAAQQRTAGHQLHSRHATEACPTDV